MAIYRIHKEDNFVIIDKAFLLNEEISLKAKGLLALLLSYPDNWQFYKAEIVQHTTDKENSLNSGLKELMENGYIVRKQRKDRGRKRACGIPQGRRSQAAVSGRRVRRGSE